MARFVVPVDVTVTIIVDFFVGWTVPKRIGSGDTDICTPLTGECVVIEVVENLP
jgi:hypothetical protein